MMRSKPNSLANHWPRHRRPVHLVPRRAAVLTEDCESLARCDCFGHPWHPCPRCTPDTYSHFAKHRPDRLRIWLGVWG